MRMGDERPVISDAAMLMRNEVILIFMLREIDFIYDNIMISQ
jgi:hypothetical protein